MEQKQFKEFAIEELKLDDDSRTIEGFASVFGNVDSYNDIVMPGAFSKTLKRMKAIPMLWQHDTREVVGKWDQFEERDRGLYVKGKISKTARGDEAYTLLKDGAITGMSIGYSADKYEIDQDKGTRKLLEVKLYEVSLVTFPANEKAQVTRVKSAPDNERDFEELLREAGYSRDAAKIITARGFKALSSQREAEADGLNSEQLAELSALLANFRKTLTN